MSSTLPQPTWPGIQNQVEFPVPDFLLTNCHFHGDRESNIQYFFNLYDVVLLTINSYQPNNSLKLISTLEKTFYYWWKWVGQLPWQQLEPKLKLQMRQNLSFCLFSFWLTLPKQHAIRLQWVLVVGYLSQTKLNKKSRQKVSFTMQGHVVEWGVLCLKCFFSSMYILSTHHEKQTLSPGRSKTVKVWQAVLALSVAQ